MIVQQENEQGVFNKIQIKTLNKLNPRETKKAIINLISLITKKEGYSFHHEINFLKEMYDYFDLVEYGDKT